MDHDTQENLTSRVARPIQQAAYQLEIIILASAYNT